MPIKLYYINTPTTQRSQTTTLPKPTMTTIFVQYPKISSRYTLQGATTVDQVIQSVQCIDDIEHTEIEFEYQDRTPTLIARAKNGIRGSTLKNGMDYVQLYLYLLEFWGYGQQARTNTAFLEKMTMENLPKRRKSYYEKVVLLKFSFISENRETFKNEILQLRQSVNDYWRDIFVKHETDEDKTIKTYFPYRYARIRALKSVYGENWANWIWRIVDIDELGMYYYDTCPIIRQIEEERTQNITE